jgi:hypothetical protein
MAVPRPRAFLRVVRAPGGLCLRGKPIIVGQTPAVTALRREKQIKEWKRDQKINLIEHENRDWVDLFPTLTI